MKPVISVIIPAYNEEKNIVECLQSLINQTFREIEFICVDDNSSDSTYERICQFAERDSRIIPFKNTGKGVASARNFGISKAKGEYIGFVDSDDTIHPQMFEMMYRAVNENDVPLAYCRYKMGADIENVVHKYESICIDMEELSISDEITVEEILFKCVWNKLIKKDFIGSIRFEDFSIGEDTRFCVNLLTQNKVKNVAFIPIKLYNYRKNANSLTNTLDDNKIYQWISARFECYEMFKQPYRRYSLFYLEQGFIYMVKFKAKYGFKDREYKRKIHNIFRKYIFSYLKSPYAAFTDKLYIIISYHFTNLSKKIYK